MSAVGARSGRGGEAAEEPQRGRARMASCCSLNSLARLAIVSSSLCNLSARPMLDSIPRPLFASLRLFLVSILSPSVSVRSVVGVYGRPAAAPCRSSLDRRTSRSSCSRRLSISASLAFTLPMLAPKAVSIDLLALRRRLSEALSFARPRSSFLFSFASSSLRCSSSRAFSSIVHFAADLAARSGPWCSEGVDLATSCSRPRCRVIRMYRARLGCVWALASVDCE